MKFKNIIITSFLFLTLAGCSTAGSSVNGTQEQNFKAMSPKQNKIVYRRPTAYNWLKINSEDPRGTMTHYVDVPTNESVNHWTQSITEAYANNKQVTAEYTAREFHTYIQNVCQIEEWSETQNSSKDITIKATVKNCQGVIAPDGYTVMRFWQGVDGIWSLSYQARLAVLTGSLKAEMVKTVANASLQSN